MARHPSTENLLRWFEWAHLPAGPLRATSQSCFYLATSLAAKLPDSPELTAGLRHLLEAKDCFVRATIAAQDAETPKWTDR